MNDLDLDEVFEQTITDILEAKPILTEDEQNYLDAWVSKLREIEDDKEKPIRHEYANHLKSQLERDPKRLSLPFTKLPPESSLPPLRDLLLRPAVITSALDVPSSSKLLQPKKPSGPSHIAVPERSRYFCLAGDKKPPCHPKGPLKKPERPPVKSTRNEFENAEEMGICIARSKGMMLAEFVADISRHTADKGHELRVAMKTETTYFSDYVDRIITQRIKDVGDLLDGKQAIEMLKIQKDYDKWQTELSICKKRLKEIVPEFDIDAYRADKNYFKKIFSVDASHPPSEDKFKEWKEENYHRLIWFHGEITKLTNENNQVLQEISAIQSMTMELESKESEKQKCYADQIRAESSKNLELKLKSDKLAREITDLLVSLKD